MSVTDEIKSRIDIVDYVQRHVPALKKAGRNHKACCPFHSEKTPSFVVNPERGTWYCFGACAEGGDLFSFAQKFHGWDFKEALRELAAEAGVQLRPQTPQEQEERDKLEHLRGLLKNAAELYHDALYAADAAAVLDYARRERGLRDETIHAFQLGYAPDSWTFMLSALRGLGHGDDDIIAAGLAGRSESGRVYDRFRNRLIFPIRDERGRVVGFGGRALDPEDNIKYINSPQSAVFDKSRLLYGLEFARRSIRDIGTAVIVEGYMDVVQAHQAGYTNVVAQMGTSMTEPQLRLVAPRHAERLVLALDADPAGQNATRRSLEVARKTLQRDFAGKLAVDIRVLEIPDGKDPDDFLRASPEGWPALVDAARGVADFVIDLETADLPADASLQVRRAVAQDILPLLLATEDNMLRQDNVQKLARRLRFGVPDLLALAQDVMQAARPAREPASGQADEHDLPPEYWDNEEAFTPPDAGAAEAAHGDPKPSASDRSGSQRVAEAYCLGVLLKHPSLLNQVNRKLRELAGDDAELLRGPLADIGRDDFTEAAHRALMTCLQEALLQHDLEPLKYVESSLDDSLRSELSHLLADELDALAASLDHRFEVDLNDVFKRRHYRVRRVFGVKDELVQLALNLRLTRLDYERLELQYLQEEALEAAETDAQHQAQISRKISLSMRAKARLDRAMSARTLPLQLTATP